MNALPWLIAGAGIGSTFGCGLGWWFAQRERTRLEGILAEWRQGKRVAVIVQGSYAEATKVDA
jgi:hypothetical protein